jgi:hypothetical protein
MKQGILDLWPSRISSHGDKKVSSSKMSIDSQGILAELLHVACAASKGWRENGPPAQVIKVGIHIGNNSICQALIQLNPKIALNVFQLSKVLLLSNCPRLTNICLKELPSKEKMVWLNPSGVNVEVIAKVLFQGNILSLSRSFLIFHLIVGNFGVSSHLSSGEKKDIAQWRIKGMRVKDSKEAVRTILSVDNNVLGASNILSITNNNNSNLIHSGIEKVIATLVTILIKVKRYLKLLIRGHGHGVLKGLLI